MQGSTINQRRLVGDLRRLGIKKGDRIFVHASFKKIGLARGGPKVVVAALQEAVGPQGSLGMPVFPFCFSPETPFDPATSPSKTGVITDTFRKTPGVVRSYSPSHSVAFWGQDAAYLVSGHGDIPPYARPGPFGKLYDLNFKIVMLGCGLAPNSTIHAIEDWAELPYTVHGVTTCYCRTDPDRQGRLYQRMPVGHRDFYIGGEPSLKCKYARLMRQHRKLHSGAVGQAPVHWMYARDLVDLSMAELDRHPDLFLCDNSKCDSCRTNQNELAAWKRNGGTRWDWVRLGRARVCITPGVDTWTNHGMGPGVLCEGVLDDLYARVLLFRQGWRKWVIVTTDLLHITRDMTDMIKTRISRRAHIAPEHIAICSSHTHYGPATGGKHIWKKDDLRDQAYMETLAVKIAGAVYTAAQEAIPVTMGFEKQRVDIGGINRRVRMPDGSYKFLGAAQHLKPNGPAARVFGMIFFYDPNGRLVGGLGHYSCHPIFTPIHLRKVTGDYAGLFAQTAEREAGAGCVIGFLQGTLGDQMPHKFCTRYELAVKAGQTLAYHFLDRSRHVKSRPLMKMALCTKLHKIRLTTRKHLVTPIQGIGLNDVGLGVIGGEMFFELTKPFEKAVGVKSLLVGVANDGLGYLPTRRAFKHPTYEVNGCQGWIGGQAGVGEELIQVCAGLVQQARSAR